MSKIRYQSKILKLGLQVQLIISMITFAVCYFEWLRWLESEMRSYLRCLHHLGLISDPDIESSGVKMSRFIIPGVTGSSKNTKFSLRPIRDFSEHGSIFWNRVFMERAPGNCSLDSSLTPDPCRWPSVSSKMLLCFNTKRVEQDPFHQH